MGGERPTEGTGKDKKSETLANNVLLALTLAACSQQKVKEETTMLEMTYGSKPNTPKKILKLAHAYK